MSQEQESKKEAPEIAGEGQLRSADEVLDCLREVRQFALSITPEDIEELKEYFGAPDRTDERAEFKKRLMDAASHLTELASRADALDAKAKAAEESGLDDA